MRIDLSCKTAKSKSHDKEKNKTVDVFLFHGNLRENGVINMFMNTYRRRYEEQNDHEDHVCRDSGESR